MYNSQCPAGLVGGCVVVGYIWLYVSVVVGGLVVVVDSMLLPLWLVRLVGVLLWLVFALVCCVFVLGCVCWCYFYMFGRVCWLCIGGCIIVCVLVIGDWLGCYLMCHFVVVFVGWCGCLGVWFGLVYLVGVTLVWLSCVCFTCGGGFVVVLVGCCLLVVGVVLCYYVLFRLIFVACVLLSVVSWLCGLLLVCYLITGLCCVDRLLSGYGGVYCCLMGVSVVCCVFGLYCLVVLVWIVCYVIRRSYMFVCSGGSLVVFGCSDLVGWCSCACWMWFVLGLY